MFENNDMRGRVKQSDMFCRAIFLYHLILYYCDVGNVPQWMLGIQICCETMFSKSGIELQCRI